jgi:prepilin-type N-terminal cleavage/methylation domain-containing protein
MKTSGAKGKTPAVARRRRLRRAFTLLEIMVVVAVMGIILAAGAPTLFRVLHREGFRKTVNEVREVCEAARAQAIIKGQLTKVIFHPHEGYCEVEGASGSSAGLARKASFGTARIDMLDINLSESKDSASPGVQFFSNGSSDEMTLILSSDKGEQLGVTLDITTGVASILNESDLQKLRNGTKR